MEVLGYGTTDVRKQICIRYVLRQYNPNPVTVFRTPPGRQIFRFQGSRSCWFCRHDRGKVAATYKKLAKEVIPKDSNDNIDYTYITAFIKAQEKLSIKSVLIGKIK